MFLTVLQIFALVATIGVGLYALLAPDKAADFTGLALPGPRGRTEMRAIFGGLFIGLGLAPLLLAGSAAYQTVAITYLAIAVGRLLGLVMDRSGGRTNWASLLVEFVFGFLLLL